MDQEVIKSKLKYLSCKLDCFIIAQNFPTVAYKNFAQICLFNLGSRGQSYKIFVVSQFSVLCKLNCFRTVKKDVNNNKMI
jgi:hypothetical protein